MKKLILKPNSKALYLYKETLNPLNQEQKEAIIGMILGDASLQKQGQTGNYRLTDLRSEPQKINHMLNIF